MANEVITNLTTENIIWNGVTEEVTVLAHEVLAAGDLVARVAASGLIVKYVSETATDGSGVPVGVIDHAVADSASNTATYIHTSGVVNENALDDTVALTDTINASADGTDTIALAVGSTALTAAIAANTDIASDKRADWLTMLTAMVAAMTATETATGANVFRVTLRDYLKMIGFTLVNGRSIDTH